MHIYELSNNKNRSLSIPTLIKPDDMVQSWIKTWKFKRLRIVERVFSLVKHRKAMPQEVLLTTSSASDSPVLLHDLHTSSHIQTFRQCSTNTGGIALTNSKSQFLAVQPDKGVVHVYSWGKDTVGTKMILPEKVRCMHISPSGTWCAGGSESGKLLLWEVPHPLGRQLKVRLQVGTCYLPEKRTISLLHNCVFHPMRHSCSLAAMMLWCTCGELWIWRTSSCEARRSCRCSHGMNTFSVLQELSAEVAAR